MTLSKKGYRTSPLVQRSTDEAQQNSRIVSDWMSQFANALEKDAVQPYRQDQQTLYDQISSVMNGAKSKFHSVDEIVSDMKARSGLLAYHSKIEAQKEEKNSTQKQAQVLAHQIQEAGKKNEEEIALFREQPIIKNTIENFLEDTNGNLPIPSVIERIKSIHQNDVHDEALWEDDRLFKFINDKSIEIKKKHPDQAPNLNLGKLPHFDEKDIDPSNNDALFSLTPTVVSK